MIALRANTAKAPSTIPSIAGQRMQLRMKAARKSTGYGGTWSYSLQLLNKAKPLTTATMWNGTRVVPAKSPKIQSPKQMNTPNQRLDETTCPDIGILS